MGKMNEFGNFGDENTTLAWKECSRKELLKTPVFTVTERHSVSPEGLEGDYIVNETRDWVIVIAEDGDSFVMVKQWRHGECSLSVEFPGGVIDDGESPEEAAERELREETGCKAGSLVKLGECNPNPALFANHFHVFLARELEFGGEQDLDSDEYVSYKRILKTEVINRMAGPECPHGLMAAALFMYMRFVA